MAEKFPRGDITKKAPKLSLKDKRTHKREKAESSVVKPRKSR